MTTTTRVLPGTTRICPGNTGICGSRLYLSSDELSCIHGHSFATREPFEKPRNGDGPKHDRPRKS